MSPELIDVAAGAYMGYLIGRSGDDGNRERWLRAGFELEWFILGYWQQHIPSAPGKYGITVSSSELGQIHTRAVELYYSRKMKERLVRGS